MRLHSGHFKVVAPLLVPAEEHPQAFHRACNSSTRPIIGVLVFDIDDDVEAVDVERYGKTLLFLSFSWVFSVDTSKLLSRSGTNTSMVSSALIIPYCTSTL